MSSRQKIEECESREAYTLDNVNLVVLTALIEYIVFILVVGATRGKYGVAAPATIGNAQWERLYRIQVNTAEQLVLFIPAIYGFAYYVNKPWAVGIGTVFLVGRVVYFFGYRKAGDKRLVGALLTAWPSYVLVVGALIGLVSTRS
ncbi:MAG: hypothetical protein COA75_08620 [Cellvibrionales bacterium]|nr:MAG: hypothetical protein COA75_08620 [Cellvibrionales bacterium]